MELPQQVPEKGFYYHYKHNPQTDVNNYAYEVVGIGLHTEEDAWEVVYRPLYENALVYKAGKCFDIRPLSMFVEENVADKNGTIHPHRFTKITDETIIAELSKIREKMYGA